MPTHQGYRHLATTAIPPDAYIKDTAIPLDPDTSWHVKATILPARLMPTSWLLLMPAIPLGTHTSNHLP
ncbi:hypothetical protein B0H14DRAFT_3467705 [Mycena olivaceomarginata]|nr:hypothetical protein B0H14DRAFT_3467705 [Mycena olivaceomarginata]